MHAHMTDENIIQVTDDSRMAKCKNSLFHRQVQVNQKVQGFQWNPTERKRERDDALNNAI